MLDPLSVTGLTLGVFDELLRLGERTAELITDIKGFHEDCKALIGHVNNENYRNKTLRQLLFEASPIYAGQTLFEQFDEDVQNQVNLLLVEAVSVLGEARDLLQRRYGSSEDRTSLSPEMSNVSLYGTTTLSSSASTPLLETTSLGLALRKKTRRTTLKMIRWSLRDKKRAEIIVSNFAAVNSRIHEYIKLVSLGGSIGVNLKHLKHLQEDENSRSLGFHIDATLELTIRDAHEVRGTMELDESWTTQLADLGKADHFAVFVRNGQSYLRENRAYDGRGCYVRELEPIAKGRVDSLARLLYQPKEQIFRIPRCTGWRYIAEQNNIAFVFNNPSSQNFAPISLRQLLASGDVKLSLDSLFHLAHDLARCIAQLQMVKWLHESFCSDNILFFPRNPSNDKYEPGENGVDYRQPWILGFDYSRPEGELSYGPVEIYPERDVYRHPERQGHVKMQFTRLHDIYALGVVLLEIGLWTPATSLHSKGFTTAKTPHVIKEQLIKHAERRLASHLGPRYRDLVLKCLKGDFGVTNDTKEDLKLQQAFRTQVVEVLKKAADNV